MKTKDYNPDHIKLEGLGVAKRKNIFRFIVIIIGGLAMLKKILAVAVVLVVACCVIWIVSASPNEVPAPLIPKEKLQQYGYVQIDEKESDIKILDFPEVILIQHLVVYENSQVREDLKRKTLGMVDESVVLFFAVRADIVPDVDNLPLLRDYVMKIAKESAKEYFEQELRNYGLTNIQLVEEREIIVNTGEKAKVFVYSAEYKIPELSFQLTQDKRISLDAGSLKVAGILAVWHHGDYIIIAGGAYPAENYLKTFKERITEAIEVTIKINLGFQPEKYEEEIMGSIKSTE